MNETHFLPQESDEERKRLEQMAEEARILTDVARDHTDELLTADAWKTFGLDRVNQIDLNDFEWSVYVTGAGGQRCVGVKILDEHGLYDMREFDLGDQTLPPSTKQHVIDEIIAQRSEKSRAVLESAKDERRAYMESERGFPEGRYRLSVAYPYRGGTVQTRGIGEIDVHTETTKDEAFGHARSLIQMYGLHNFGLDSSKRTGGSQGIKIQASLKKDDIEVPFECSVNTSGFIVTDED